MLGDSRAKQGKRNSGNQSENPWPVHSSVQHRLTYPTTARHCLYYNYRCLSVVQTMRFMRFLRAIVNFVISSGLACTPARRYGKSYHWYFEILSKRYIVQALLCPRHYNEIMLNQNGKDICRVRSMWSSVSAKTYLQLLLFEQCCPP